MRSEKKDMTGLRIGMLLVLKDSGERYSKNREVLWKCICDCGNICNVRGRTFKKWFYTKLWVFTKRKQRKI